MLPKRQRPRRQILCEQCGLQRMTWIMGRDVCDSCLEKEPKTLCQCCQKLKRQVSEESRFCPKCDRVVSRIILSCSKCAQLKPIFNQANCLCQSCYYNESRVNKKRERGKVECSKCGQLRPSLLVGENICQKCWMEDRNSFAECKKCNRYKVVFNKAEILCKECAEDRLASKALSSYINNYTTSYAYNQVIFNCLTKNIKWASVTKKIKQRIQAVGHFLQVHEFLSPLTWESIKNALPPLTSTNIYKTKLIRSCLYEIGHLLADKNFMDKYDVYVSRQKIKNAIKKAPHNLYANLCNFHNWLVEKDFKPKTIQSYSESLTLFWNWCASLNIDSMVNIQPLHINDYLQTLHWQLACSQCGSIKEFNPCIAYEQEVCIKCSSISFNKVRRYPIETVRRECSVLKTYFEWAKNSRLILFNPVRISVKSSEATILHYPFEVVRKFSNYIADPYADADEALALYLIIFHAFTSWDLRHAKLPNLIPLIQDEPNLTLADFYCICLVKPSTSRGRHSPGRPTELIRFSEVASPWLKSLLTRFEIQRRENLKNPQNQYLFVASGRSLHNKPVSNESIRRLIRRASLRVLRAFCNVKTLRTTAALIYADRAGGGVLSGMGWGDQRAFFYTWGPRQLIQPHPYNKPCSLNSAADETTIKKLARG